MKTYKQYLEATRQFTYGRTPIVPPAPQDPNLITQLEVPPHMQLPDERPVYNQPFNRKRTRMIGLAPKDTKASEPKASDQLRSSIRNWYLSRQAGTLTPDQVKMLASRSERGKNKKHTALITHDPVLVNRLVIALNITPQEAINILTAKPISSQQIDEIDALLKNPLTTPDKFAQYTKNYQALLKQIDDIQNEIYVVKNDDGIDGEQKKQQIAALNKQIKTLQQQFNLDPINQANSGVVQKLLNIISKEDVTGKSMTDLERKVVSLFGVDDEQAIDLIKDYGLNDELVSYIDSIANGNQKQARNELALLSQHSHHKIDKHEFLLQTLMQELGREDKNGNLIPASRKKIMSMLKGIVFKPRDRWSSENYPNTIDKMVTSNWVVTRTTNKQTGNSNITRTVPLKGQFDTRKDAKAQAEQLASQDSSATYDVQRRFVVNPDTIAQVKAISTYDKQSRSIQIALIALSKLLPKSDRDEFLSHDLRLATSKFASQILKLYRQAKPDDKYNAEIDGWINENRVQIKKELQNLLTQMRVDQSTSSYKNLAQQLAQLLDLGEREAINLINQHDITPEDLPELTRLAKKFKNDPALQHDKTPLINLLKHKQQQSDVSFDETPDNMSQSAYDKSKNSIKKAAEKYIKEDVPESMKKLSTTLRALSANEIEQTKLFTTAASDAHAHNPSEVEQLKRPHFGMESVSLIKDEHFKEAFSALQQTIKGQPANIGGQEVSNVSDAIYTMLKKGYFNIVPVFGTERLDATRPSENLRELPIGVVDYHNVKYAITGTSVWIKSLLHQLSLCIADNEKQTMFDAAIYHLGDSQAMAGMPKLLQQVQGELNNKYNQKKETERAADVAKVRAQEAEAKGKEQDKLDNLTAHYLIVPKQTKSGVGTIYVNVINSDGTKKLNQPLKIKSLAVSPVDRIEAHHTRGIPEAMLKKMDLTNTRKFYFKARQGINHTLINKIKQGANGVFVIKAGTPVQRKIVEVGKSPIVSPMEAPTTQDHEFTSPYIADVTAGKEVGHKDTIDQYLDKAISSGTMSFALPPKENDQKTRIFIVKTEDVFYKINDKMESFTEPPVVYEINQSSDHDVDADNTDVNKSMSMHHSAVLMWQSGNKEPVKLFDANPSGGNARSNKAKSTEATGDRTDDGGAINVLDLEPTTTKPKKKKAKVTF